MSIAHALKTLGRQQEAIESYRTAAACRPSFGDAYWSLANLKTYRFHGGRDRAHARRGERAPATPLVDRYHLCFALGKALEDRGEYAESFGYYERGNALKKAETRFRSRPIERNARLQASRVHARVLRLAARVRARPIRRPDLHRRTAARRLDAARADSRLAFARSKARWSWRTSRGSCSDLQGREPRIDNPRYPAVLAELEPSGFKQLGEKYLADTRVYRTGKPFFIDKMPNNFRHIGLIHLILPNAKIIDARREPMACCFSNFKQLFASGQEFTYSIEDIARYYRSYVELMRHWDEVLPGKILRVQHEDVVEDLEGNVRRLLDFAAWSSSRPASSSTRPSAACAPRVPSRCASRFSKRGLDQWRHFEPWLGALKSALGHLAQGAASGSGKGIDRS